MQTQPPSLLDPKPALRWFKPLKLHLCVLSRHDDVCIWPALQRRTWPRLVENAHCDIVAMIAFLIQGLDGKTALDIAKGPEVEELLKKPEIATA